MCSPSHAGQPAATISIAAIITSYITHVDDKRINICEQAALVPFLPAFEQSPSLAISVVFDPFIDDIDIE